jgi:hypothetical protein
MSRAKLSNGSRLEFANSLSSRVRRPMPSAWPLGRILVLVVGVVLVVAAGVWCVRHLHFSKGIGKDDPLAQVSRTILEALKANKLEDALAVCADGPAGRALLDEENQRLAKKDSPANPAQAPPRVASQSFLQEARDQLAKVGVEWETIRPLAFSGVEAAVLDPRTMQTAATSITGDLYFAAGSAVYALEFTGRRCKKSVVVTDFWRCTAANATPETVSECAKERFRAFKQETTKSESPVRIKSAEYIYIPLQP